MTESYRASPEKERVPDTLSLSYYPFSLTPFRFPPEKKGYLTPFLLRM